MRTDTYKVVARVKAWMALSRFSHLTLRKAGIDIEQFQVFIDEYEDGEIKNTRLVKHIACAMNADIDYLLEGCTPINLRWQDRLALKVFQAYHEFYSRELRAARFTANTLSSFVKQRIEEYRIQIYSPAVASYMEDMPTTLISVGQDFEQWQKEERRP